MFCAYAESWLATPSTGQRVFVFQLWVQERMAVATSTEHGHNLQTVQLLMKKNQVRLLLHRYNPSIADR